MPWRSQPADEDGFLWDEPEENRVTLSEAEKLAVRLSFDVALQSAIALEDPNERLFLRFGDLNLFEQPPKLPSAREVSSDELSNHRYEIEVEGGILGFEVNPPDVPALTRVALIGGRPEAVMSKLLLAFDRTNGFQAFELPPLRMVEPDNLDGAGNRFFRLQSAVDRNRHHDVACLLAWLTLENGSKLLEITAWPVEIEDVPRRQT